MEATPSGAVNSLFSRSVGLTYSTSADYNVRDAALLGPSKVPPPRPPQCTSSGWLMSTLVWGVARGASMEVGRRLLTGEEDGSPRQSQTVGRKGPALN